MRDKRAMSEYQKSWYIKNKEAVLQKQKVYKDQKRERQISELTGGTNMCSGCGNPDFRLLEVHHVNFNGNEDRSGKFPDKVYEKVALCCNCHKLRHLKV